MKLQPDKSNAPMVRAHGQGWIEVGHDTHTQSLLVSNLPELPVVTWEPQKFGELQDRHLTALASMGAELVILGTGARLQFVPNSWLRAFAERRVGLETMDTAAACRTYNVLASEGRKVIAALLIETAAN